MRRRLVLAMLAIVGALSVYPMAALIGGAIPSNADWQEPATGVTLFIESNGVHTGIVMPKRAAGIDWSSTFPGSDLGDPRYAGHDHVSIGWGERAFYLSTPTWADLEPATILAAAFGSDATLIHVDHVPRPGPMADVRRLTVTPAQYRRLAGYIRGALKPGGERHRGYFAYDAFYDARGHYSGIRTCNAWIGDALRHAGVRTGAWTPFPLTVQWWYPPVP